MAGGDLVAQRAVGRGHHPHVYPTRLGATDAQHLAFL